MRPIAWMTALGALMFLGGALAGARWRDVGLGVLGPVLVSDAAWVLMERTHRRSPEALTSTLVVAFGAKMVVFGLYLAAVLRWLPGGPRQFVATFVGSFVALHLVEALFLRRLLGGGTRLS
jgi:hypothetical protein